MTTDNVIEVRFGNSTLVSISPKYRYDSGWIMKFVDLDLPESYQVHFGNTLDGDTIEVIGDSNGVEIPDILWTNGEIIYCWLYLHPTEDSSITKKEVRIAVGNRGKLPAGVTPEPHEQTIIDQLITVMNRSADKAEQNAQEAELSADRSEASATLAEGYLASVRSDAEVARTKAQEAESSAVEAEQSETSAQNYAQMSANSASEAQGYAEELAESIAEAKGYSESAGISAHNAEVYADQAEIAKTEAISGKEAIISAKNEAVLAKSEAVIAKNEAVLAKTDAEQAKTDAQTAQGLAESARDLAQGYAEDAQGYANDAQASAEGISASASQIAQNTANILKAFPTDTASGAVASFSDGADDIPLKSLIVNIDPVQDTSSGDPSPENICPISGWTQIDVNHSGADMTNPTTITIDLGQTVYGGKLDVLSGELVIDRAMVDLGTLTWGLDTGQSHRFIAYNQVAAKPTGNYSVAINAICSTYKNLTQNQLYSNNIGVSIQSMNGKSVYVYDDAYDNATAFKTAMTGQTLVYELATPIEIQLSANQLNSLYGVNNIWADSGDTEVEYRADTKAYIAKKIAEALASLT